MDPEHEFRGTDRFQVLSWLGDGGMGVVYAALDRERNARVALKSLRTLSADAVLRFKTEFRSLQDIHHTNLVSLGELIEHEGQWLLTMELVEGVHFLEWVRGGASPDPPSPSGVPSGQIDDGPTLPLDLASPTAPPCDEVRLRAAMAQVARGLGALHAAQKVHRDIKPSNLIVTPAGRAVILDFGFVTEITPRSLSNINVVGTPAYMAPEQAASQRLGPAADLYSVGVILYEALTGRLPFPGAPLEVLMQKQRAEPPPPRALVSGVPRDLDTLCVELLSIEPARRPSAAELERRLGSSDSRPISAQGTPPLTGSGGPVFVGRARELAQLSEAFAASRAGGGAAVTVLVEGESGLGKTALVQRFLRSLEPQRDVVVLSGRCYERESVPFKAVDGVIDALSRHLMRLPPAEAAAVLPRKTNLLVQVFPVLRRVEAAAAAPMDAPAARDPKELRSRVFGALRELLGRLAERRRIVITIDDLQWADADSLALLGEVLRPPDAPPVLLIATKRPTTGDDAAAAAAFAAEARHINLVSLSPDNARELVGLLLRAAGSTVTVDVATIVTEAGGHPLFIDELVRHVLSHGMPASGRQRLEDALWSRIQRLDDSSRRVLELVAVAAAQLPQEVVMRAAALQSTAFAREVATLRVANLVRTTGARPSDAIETYHDRIREIVVAYLDPAQRTAHHHRLAIALESAPIRSDEALAVHWDGAGEPVRAAGHAVRAAAQAAEALAFARAARLYRLALALVPASDAEGVQELQCQLADALANLGHGEAAGRAYLAAAEHALPEDALELRRRAADQLLRSGHIDDGIDTMRAVLAALGMKLADSPQRALASFLYRRALLRLRGLGFRERRESELPAAELRRLDACWSIALGLGLVDFVRGADFQARHQLLALRTGEPKRIARSLATEAAYSAGRGVAGHRRTQELLDMAGALAKRLGDPQAAALTELMSGVSAFLEGRWPATREHCEKSEVVFREQCLGASYETTTAQQFQMWALIHMGEFAEVARRHPGAMREAVSRGDRYAETNLRVGHPTLLWIAADDPARARAESNRGMREWSGRDFQIQHCFDLWGNLNIDLYEGDPAAALQRLDSQWPLLEDSLLLRVQLIRILLLHVRARVTLAATQLPHADRKQLLAGARADANKILRDKTPWGRPHAEALAAVAAEIEGKREQAIELLARAETGFTAVHMGMQAAAVQRRRGELLADEAGAALIATADAWMRGQGIKRPARMAQMALPGPKSA